MMLSTLDKPKVGQKYVAAIRNQFGLAVQDGDKLIGLVSMRDVMTMMISIKEDRIQRLENSILGAEYQH